MNVEPKGAVIALLRKHGCVDQPVANFIRSGPDHMPSFQATLTWRHLVVESDVQATKKMAENQTYQKLLVQMQALLPDQPNGPLSAASIENYKSALQEIMMKSRRPLPEYKCTVGQDGNFYAQVTVFLTDTPQHYFSQEGARTKKLAEQLAAKEAKVQLSTGGLPSPQVVPQGQDQAPPVFVSSTTPVVQLQPDGLSKQSNVAPLVNIISQLASQQIASSLPPTASNAADIQMQEFSANSPGLDDLFEKETPADVIPDLNNNAEQESF
eukprot:TRINITY_DN10463_c0_g2_i1.p1 TRINITY_DN10463_c0_g2~~TRINITY_DN10463_c0_g2_i1.p1  ORF type:complete len:268 (-),score=41.53 TRINITY_DN10463_c0_g2_i1:53-856(-)